MPALADLTSKDFDKIRLIVKEEVKTEITTVKQELKAEITTVKQELKAEIAKNAEKIDTLDTRFEKVEQSVAWMRGNLDKVHQQTAWIIVLIIVAIGIPQIIVIPFLVIKAPLMKSL